MSENNTQDTNVAPVAPIKAGFIAGLMGTKVMNKDTKEITDYVFTAAKSGVTLVSYSKVEAPYPVTQDAALEAAEDCETSVWVFEDGKYVQKEVKGVAAAVCIALSLRRDESFRSRLRNGNYDSDVALRSDAKECYGFELPGQSRKATVVDQAALMAILSDADASMEEKIAAMRALGIKIA